MAIVLVNFEVDDYDQFKQKFDEDPGGRREGGATGHMISRAVDNPNNVFIRTEFPSVDQARAFIQRLQDSGAIQSIGARLNVGPVVAEVAESVTY